MFKRLYTWGGAVDGTLANGTTSPNLSSPVLLDNNIDYDKVSIGGNRILAIRNGVLYIATSTSPSFTQVGSLTDWTDIAAGGDYHFAIRDGKLYSAGANNNGVTGQGNSSGTTTTLTQVGSETSWTAISTPKTASFGRWAAGICNGQLLTWGLATNYRLGNNNNTADVLVPTVVNTDTDWQKINCGPDFGLAIKNGQLWSWGSNNSGCTGQGTASGTTNVPTRVGILENWTEIATGRDWGLGIKDGYLYGWGNNTDGNNGTGSTRSSPFQIGNDQDWQEIDARQNSTTDGRTSGAIKGGSLYTWGGDNAGCLGNGDSTTTDVTTPTLIDSQTNWKNIYFGQSSAAALQEVSPVPNNFQLPELSGTVKISQNIKTTNGIWAASPNPTYNYQWQVSDNGTTGWSDISGATSSTYTITSSEAGKYLRSKITATNDAGSSDAFSKATPQIVLNNIINSYSEEVLADIPWLYWKLNENAGSSTTADNSNNNRSGTLSKHNFETLGYESLITNNPSEKSFYTSSTEPDSYYLANSFSNGSNDYLNIFNNNNSASIEGWIKYDGIIPSVSQSRLFGQSSLYITKTSGSRLQFGLSYNNTTELTLDMPTDMISNTVYHVVGTVSLIGSTGTAILYINGNQVATTTFTASNLGLKPSSNYFAVGRQLTTAGRGQVRPSYWIDDVSVYNEALSAQRVLDHYNAGISPPYIIPANTVAPAVSGTVKVGQTLTTDDGTWTGTPTPTYQRQWQVSDNGTTGWSDISGATSSTYIITASEAGKYLRSKITATNDAGSVDAFSAATTQVTQNPTNTAVPVVTGTARVGESLSTDNGTWQAFPTATYTYQWQVSDNGTSNWSNISGATFSTYIITASEASKYIRSRVTATNTEEAVSAVSVATAQITQTPTNTVAPVITGIEKVGETLTMDNGTWQSYPSATYTYTWQKSTDSGSSWSAISGATSASYLLTTNEAGLLVRGKVTATNSEGAVDAFTDPTDNILEDPQIDQVVINGLPAKVGDELTASALATAGYPQPFISYQWYREINEVFTLITGANLNTYTPVSADAGLILKVIATATNIEGTDSSEEVTEETLWAPANTSIPTISHPNHLEVGENLTADPGEWTGYPDPAEVGFSYQWQISDDGDSGWTNVLGETGDQLYLDESFAEKYVRIKVTATTTAGTADAYSVTTGFISKDPEVIETPLINGITEIDEVLTVDPGVWGGFPEPNFSYQWERSINGSTNWQYIDGETEDQITLTSSEVSYFIRCLVTGTNPVGSTTAASEVVGPVLQAPFLIDAPEITGNARQLQTLTLDIGEWGGFEDPTLDVAISWEISPDGEGDWETIEGAEDDSYLIPEDDDLFGYYIRALVDVSNSAGSLAEYSNSLGPIDYLWTLPEFIEGPEIDGINRVNSTLEVSFDFDGYPAPTAFIQWQRQEEGEAWENIAGEEGTTYLIQEIDLDYIITAQVTLINDEGSLVAYSELTDPIQPELIGPILIDDPEITGSFEVSKQLTAYLGDYDGYPDVELAEDGLIWEYAADPDGPWRPIQEIDQAISWIPDEDFVGYYLRLNITVENVVDVLNVVSDSFGPIVPRLYVQPQVLPVTNARLVAIHSQNGGNIGVEFDSEFTLEENEQRNKLLWHGNSDAYLRFKTAVKYSSGQMDKIKETTALIPKFIEVDQGSVLTIFYNKKTYTYRVADVTEINQDPAMAPMLKCVLIDPGFSDDPQFEA